MIFFDFESKFLLGTLIQILFRSPNEMVIGYYYLKPLNLIHKQNKNLNGN